MATREALKAAERLRQRRVRVLNVSVVMCGMKLFPYVAALERAAIKVGEIRERNRKERGK